MLQVYPMGYGQTNSRKTCLTAFVQAKEKIRLHFMNAPYKTTIALIYFIMVIKVKTQ
jgi:hypothetical protein